MIWKNLEVKPRKKNNLSVNKLWDFILKITTTYLSVFTAFINNNSWKNLKGWHIVSVIAPELHDSEIDHCAPVQSVKQYKQFPRSCLNRYISNFLLTCLLTYQIYRILKSKMKFRDPSLISEHQNISFFFVARRLKIHTRKFSKLERDFLHIVYIENKITSARLIISCLFNVFMAKTFPESLFLHTATCPNAPCPIILTMSNSSLLSR